MIQPHRWLIHYSLFSQQVLGAFAQLLLQASPGRSVITVVKRCSPKRHHSSGDRAPVPGRQPFQLFWQLVMARDCTQIQILQSSSCNISNLLPNCFSPAGRCYVPDDWWQIRLFSAPVFGRTVRLPIGNVEIFSPSRFPLFSSRLGNILPTQVWD